MLPEVALPAEAALPSAGASRRIPELDGIRGIAILLVIGCHYEVFARQLWGLPKFGWIGVDIFFVLSGFLITSVLLNLRGRADSFSTFYSRRFRRILPPYICLGSAGNGGAAFPVSVDSAPSGRGFSRHWGSIVR
jgi:peptidoglycan/LPS O-acetylase OafA/YrhL